MRVDVDPSEERAIMKRRAAEAERKKRILDPVLQRCAVNVSAIEQQIAEKRNQRQQQLAEEAAYAEQVRRIQRAAEEADQLARQQQREQYRDMTTVNHTLQREHHHRAAADPWSPRNQKPPRTEQSVEGCGVSSVQVLAGEDWTFQERQRRQKEQRQLWYLQHQQEQRAKEAAEAQRRDEEARHLLRVDRQVQEMQTRTHADTAGRQREQWLVNQRLAEQQREARAATEAGIKAAQQTTLVTQTWADLTLDRPHVWKYYTEEQRRRVLDGEARDRAAAEKRREAEAEKKRDALRLQQALTEATEQLDASQLQHRQAVTRQTAVDNLQKSTVDKERIRRNDRAFTTNTPTEDFFSQFGTTSR